MNADSSRDNLDDDLTATGTAPGLEGVESMALEALTAASSPRPIPIPDEDRTATVGHEGDRSGDDLMIGRRIGPYELTARIGGGGIGTVYRAARVEDFRQEVAITLIRRGRDSDAIVRRFQAEVHVHAALGKHPNIAGLLDTGTTDDGRPYVVMEYIDGRRIDVYCDDLRLNIPTRLRLFRKVCEVVHFAHQHMVIHRDLKPGNILIAGDGVPQVINFGIARLIHPEPGEPVLTPEYASPEQVQGEPITTASDVYALGAVLYQLLTGRGPYRLEEHSTSEMFQAICEQVPERPARRSSAGRSRARMRCRHQRRSRSRRPDPRRSPPPRRSPRPAAFVPLDSNGFWPAILMRS